MMNDPVNPNHIGDASVASTRMTTQSSPPSLGPKTAQRTSLGHRLQRALTGGPNRRSLGLHPSPGGAASLPSFLNRRLALPILAILALLAASLLFLLPGGLLQAQDATIDYAENDTIPVATFTGSDPEGRPVYWSLLATDALETPEDIDPSTDSAEVAHFSISANGVLGFNFPPDYEAPPTPPTNTAAPNTYRVVVVAADEPLGATNRALGYEKVTVSVTDKDEGGVISLDAQQPEEGRLLTASLSDDDASEVQKMAAKWEWEHSESTGGPWAPILTARSAAFTPLGVADKYLRATATYTDGHGSDKNAQVVAPHIVRAKPAANNANPVFPPDEDPVAEGIVVGRKVDENSPPGTRVGDPVEANDAPGDVLTYTLADANDNNNYSIHPATGQITIGPRTALDFETNPRDTVNVGATDPTGGTATQVVIIIINDVNEDPVITAGDTEAMVAEVTDDSTPQAGAIYTADPEVSGTPCAAATCAWSLKGADAGDFEIGNQAEGTPGELTFKEAPNYEAPADANRDNMYMVTVVVTDAGIEGKGKLSAERDVVVTVTNVNEGAEGTVVTLSSLQPKVGVPLTATLDDPDGGEKDIEWQWRISGANIDNVPGAEDLTVTPPGNISGATSATYTPKLNDVAGTLTATVTYADALDPDQTGMKEAANAVVQDLAAKAPVFDPKPTSRSVPENYKTDDTYGTDPDTYRYPNVGAVVTATDPNGGIRTYSLGGADMGSFSIDQMSGQITVETGTKLNREAKATYMVTVTATDPGGLSDSVHVTIKLTDIDEGPEIAGDDISRDYPENGTGSVATLRATDPERRPVYWSLLATNALETPEDIDPSTDSAEVAHFSISANGVLGFNFPPDYEAPPTPQTNTAAPNTYRVVVVAADEPLGATNRELGYKKVTVNVTDLEETETVTLSLRQVQVDTAVTATYNDLDMERPDNTNLTWKWYLGGHEASTATGPTSTSTYTPENSGSLRAEASYIKTDGSEKAASATITVRPVPSDANVNPAFPTGSNLRSVDENSPPGTRVGSAVTATDPGDVLTYTLAGGNDNDNYSIHPATGQITVGPRTALDRESIGGAFTHTVNVTATDPAGGTATQVVTITINDVNEDPVITAGDTEAMVAEVTDDSTPQAGVTYTADPEVSGTACAAATCAWSLKGADAGDFEIGNQAEGTPGELTFKEAPNYEAPADANRDNMYMVTVVVTDAGIEGKGKLSAERDVVVTVTNVNEGAEGTVVTLSSLQPKVGVPLTATLDDPDGGEKDIEWQWRISGANIDNVPGAEDLTVTPPGNISGATSATYTPKLNDVAGTLTATVTYADALDPDQTGMKEAANAVVQDLAAKAPVFDPKPTSRSVPENYETDDTYGTDPDTYRYPNVGAVVTATDPNGGIRTYSLGGADMGSFSIDQGTGQITVKTATKLDREAKATYMVTVTATDPGGLSDSVHVTIKLTDEDEVPEITRKDALTNQSPTFPGAATTRRVVENTVAGADIGAPVAATDADNDALTYFLSGTDAASFDIISATGQLQTKAALDYETKASYSVTVTAADSGGLSDFIDVTITVTDVDENVAPEFADSEDGARSVPENTVAGEEIGNPVAASDANGDALTYALSGTDAASFDIISATGQLQTKAALDYETKATYSVTVTATDEAGLSDSVDVTITVTDVDENVAPEFAPTEDGARSVPEDTVAGEEIGAPVAATDADNDALTYALSGTDAASFDIISATGQLQTKAALDYETKDSYSVTVTATDEAGLSDSIDVTITVTDVDETVAPEFAASEDGARSVPENTVAGQNIGAPVAATDADNDALTYALSGTDAASFDIISATGQLQTKAALDYETKDSYSVTVTATDSGGLSDSIDVTITVTDVDENVAPEFAASEDGARSVPENTVAGQNIGAPVAATDSHNGALTYALSGTDAASFDIISATGQLQTKAALDYETKDSYTVTVTATDEAGLSDSIDVTITVTDVDENVAPEFAASEDGARSVPENTVAGEEIGAPVAASDANGDALTYALSGTDAAAFDIISATGQLQTKAALDYETKDSYSVTVTATDSGGLSDSVDVTITVTDVDENVAPEFAASEDGARSVPENTVAGEEIGAPVAASDANGDALTYALSGTDAAAFDIISATGQLQTKAALDYETKATYSVTVTATDSGGLSDSVDVTITVTDVDEAGTGDPLVDGYDADGSGTIDRAEVGQAVRDFIDRQIEHDDVVLVIAQYFKDLRSGS